MHGAGVSPEVGAVEGDGGEVQPEVEKSRSVPIPDVQRVTVRKYQAEEGVRVRRDKKSN